MKVYIPTDRNRPTSHTIYCTPGGDVEFCKGDVPSEWKDQEGNALSIPVTFKNGMADIPNNLGDYLIARGLARKTKLHLPGDPANA